MEYKGKLYGKIGNKYFDTSHTAEDWDKLTDRVKELEQKLQGSNTDLLHDVTQRLKRRQLVDRIEEYSDIIEGKCTCGEKVNKVLNSSCTGWKNGDRYHYPKDNTAWCIFRCESCNEPIHETFKSDSDVG